MKNSCPQWGWNLGHSAYETKSLSVALLDEMSTEHLNVDRVLPECAITIYLCLVPRGRCSKMFCFFVYYILLTL